MMSWNILSDGLAVGGGFPIADATLSWEYRFPLMLEHIGSVKPDVLALLECNHFEDFAGGPLKTHAGLFAPKLRSPSLEFGKSPDGTALFLSRERFEVQEVDIVYCTSPSGGLSNSNAILALVRDLKSGAPAGASAEGAEGGGGATSGPPRSLLIAATHLKAGSSASDDAMRAHQLRHILSRIVAMLARHGQSRRTQGVLPVLLCGDMNAMPNKPCIQEVLTHPLLAFRSAYAPPLEGVGASAAADVAAEPDAAAPGSAAGRGEGDAAAAPSAAVSPPVVPPATSPPSHHPPFTTWKFRKASHRSAGSVPKKAAALLGVTAVETVPEAAATGGGAGAGGAAPISSGAAPASTSSSDAASCPPKAAAVLGLPPAAEGGATAAPGAGDAPLALHEKKEVIDYIWLANAQSTPPHLPAGAEPLLALAVAETLLLPTEEEIGEGALPHAQFPSDHLAVAARLHWLPFSAAATATARRP